MGYVKEKYTREYFLNEDKNGNRTEYGCFGIEEFYKGTISRRPASILKMLDFKDKYVLDIGFGRGESIKWAIENGARKVIGIDFSLDAEIIAHDYLNDNNCYKLLDDIIDINNKDVILDLEDWNIDLYCLDILIFLRNMIESMNDKEYFLQKFDIILMLDVFEHIPREELKEILVLLDKVMNDTGIIAINTPFYNIDNDIIEDGLKDKAKDTSDLFPETQGMHCNRYTKKSLEEFMIKYGYKLLYSKIHPIFYVKDKIMPQIKWNEKLIWNKMIEKGISIKELNK